MNFLNFKTGKNSNLENRTKKSNGVNVSIYELKEDR